MVSYARTKASAVLWWKSIRCRRTCWCCLESCLTASARLLLPGKLLDRLRTPLAPLLATTHPPLCLLELLFGLTVVTQILNDLSVGRDEEYLQPHINAGLLAG